MAVRVRCPNGHALNVGDDLLGKRIRCPKCGEMFRAEEVAEAPPKKKAVKKRKADDEDDDEPRRPAKRRPRDDDFDDDDDDDDDNALGTIQSNLSPEERRKERQRDRRERLKKVNIGLLIHIIKLWAVVVLVLFIFLFRVFDVAVETVKQPTAEKDLSPEAIGYFVMFADIAKIIVLSLTVITPIIGIASCVFCCMIPKKSEARPTIFTSLAFDVLPLIASVMIPLAAFEALGLAKPANERLLTMLLGASIFFSVAALFLFAVYLRQLAKYLQKTTLAAEALNLVSWLMIMTLAAPAVLYGMQILGPMIQGGAGSVINVAVLFILTLVWFAMFYYMFFQPMVRLIQTIRAEIDA